MGKIKWFKGHFDLKWQLGRKALIPGGAADGLEDRATKMMAGPLITTFPGVHSKTVVPDFSDTT